MAFEAIGATLLDLGAEEAAGWVAGEALVDAGAGALIADTAGAVIGDAVISGATDVATDALTSDLIADAGFDAVTDYAETSILEDAGANAVMDATADSLDLTTDALDLSGSDIELPDYGTPDFPSTPDASLSDYSNEGNNYKNYTPSTEDIINARDASVSLSDLGKIVNGALLTTGSLATMAATVRKTKTTLPQTDPFYRGVYLTDPGGSPRPSVVTGATGTKSTSPTLKRTKMTDPMTPEAQAAKSATTPGNQTGFKLTKNQMVGAAVVIGICAAIYFMTTKKAA